MVTVLTDADIAERLDARSAVGWMREAVLAAHSGALHTPPRVSTELGDGRLVFTTGALTGEWYGYRSYDSFSFDPGAQLVVVHEWHTGAVRGLAVGNELGPRRVGAIGAVALDALAAPTAGSLGLVGTGTQAWNQLWAISTVRSLTSVSVFSRDPVRRNAFVARVSAELGLPVAAADSAREAVEGKDLVVLATNSPVPVVEASWIAPGGYVTTLGPKQVGRAEFGPDLVARADVAVTDSVAQTSAYDPPFILTGTEQHDRLTSLGAVLAGEAPGRTSADQTVIFCSVGLAGTETYLLARLLG
ncbi:ornithine cyclodeaminase family protein [Kribbella sp. VKM Ac-2568]|uniref:ornithine cyclodeaminase family protein n=1 Tax=Kribbella sp. VKM Ac-2568 TaxID=2512219 RepID=UPI00104EDE21|nr:ornithine cyclodeaminase family protein [Kribbella sp. VKM Ac-2568]TCM47686.1 ornithine cyclodeaminase [Kribbella sp. VKM Ac-2568]